VPLELDILQRSAEDMRSETVRLGWADVVPPFRVFLVGSYYNERADFLSLGCVGKGIGFSSSISCGSRECGMRALGRGVVYLRNRNVTRSVGCCWTGTDI
jgi:hypothetical protein